MRLGIFSKTFVRPSLGETLDAVLAGGIRMVQFNLVSASLPSMPARLTDAECARIRGEMERRGITNAVLSATFNIIHPDPATREAGFQGFSVLAAAARRLGTNTLSVSTGTRDAADMWRKHPDNDGSGAWRDMAGAMARLAGIAQEQDVTVAFEPEQANIVDSAAKARKLLDTLRSARVKVLIDAANLLNESNLSQQDQVLRDAFEQIGDDIVIAHAKEYSAGGRLGGVALGRGAVNFPLYLSLLKQAAQPVPVIMHGFDESAVPESLDHLKGILAR